MANHYEILDIDPSSDGETIKSAYRKLSRRYHPDITGDAKGHFFVMLTDAYETLSNPVTRRNYDLTLQPASKSSPAPSNNNTSSSPNTSYRRKTSGPVKPMPAWDTFDWNSKDWSGVKERIIVRNEHQRGKIIWGIVFFILFSLFLVLSVVSFSLWVLAIFILSILTLKKWFKAHQSPGSGAFIALHLLMVAGVSWIFFDQGETAKAWLSAGVGMFSVFAGGRNLSEGWAAVDEGRGRGSMPLEKEHIQKYAFWGKAGNLSDATDKFGERNVEMGAIGEKFTAELVQGLLDIPGTRIFHGLKFPGSETADVDHAVVNGNKVMFIDSKMWQSGKYSWGYEGSINLKTSRGESVRETNFPYAVDEYKKAILPPHVEIRGAVLIYANDGGKVTVDSSKTVNDVMLADIDTFLRETGDWFAQSADGTIDRGLLNTFIYNLKD